MVPGTGNGNTGTGGTGNTGNGNGNGNGNGHGGKSVAGVTLGALSTATRASAATTATTTTGTVTQQPSQGRSAHSELEGTSTTGTTQRYTRDMKTIMDAADINHDGSLTGAELDKVKLWVDHHHDGKVHEEDLKSLRSVNVVRVDLRNGDVITRDLCGYRTVASPQVCGHFGQGSYGVSGGSRWGFDFSPTSPSQSLLSVCRGLGSYDGQGWGSFGAGGDGFAGMYRQYADSWRSFGFGQG